MQLKRGKRLYAHLWRATDALNSAFSLMALVYFTVSLSTLILMLYGLVLSLRSSTPILQAMGPTGACQLFLYGLTLLLILTGADTSVQHVRTVNGLIHFHCRLGWNVFVKVEMVRQALVTLSTDSRDPAVRLEVSSFLACLSEEEIRISAAGLFHIGTHLVPYVNQLSVFIGW